MDNPQFKYSRGGGRSCAVRGCSYNQKKLTELLARPCTVHFPQPLVDCACDRPYTFFSPKSEDERRQWLSTLQLKKPPKYLTVCSFHFVEKKPTEQNPLPQLFLGYERVVKKTRRILVRTNRESATPLQKGKRKAESGTDSDAPGEKRLHTITADVQKDEASTPVSDHEADAVSAPSSPIRLEDEADLQPTTPAEHHQAPLHDEFSVNRSTAVHVDVHHYSKEPLVAHDGTKATVVHVGTQCQMDSDPDAGIAPHLIQSDDDANLYTGVPSAVFWTIVTSLVPFSKSCYKKVGVHDQILMTLMKLRLNLLLADLGKRFGCSESLVSRMISHWISTMAYHFTDLTVWLPRETIRATLPDCFTTNYPKTTCIWDCAETIMQKANNLQSRSESYSTYKSHNTIKYLVSIAPNGLIMFISQAYGGRASDRFIVQDCGILKHLMPGDEVMADRGFTIDDLLFQRQVKLNIPAFTNGNQLSEENVTMTRRLASVRIHVERAIRRLKVFKILKDTVPVSMTKKVDSVLRICAALVNLRGDLIRDKSELAEEELTVAENQVPPV